MMRLNQQILRVSLVITFSISYIIIHIRVEGDIMQDVYDETEKIARQERLAFLGKRITEIRLQKGISEKRFSEELGKNKGYLQNISSGRSFPGMNMFFDICEALEVTPEEFFATKVVSNERKRIDILLDKMNREELSDWLSLMERYIK